MDANRKLAFPGKAYLCNTLCVTTFIIYLALTLAVSRFWVPISGFLGAVSLEGPAQLVGTTAPKIYLAILNSVDII